MPDLLHETENRKLWEEETSTSSIAPSQAPPGVFVNRDAKGQIVVGASACQQALLAAQDQRSVAQLPISNAANARHQTHAHIAVPSAAARQKSHGNAPTFRPALHGTKPTSPKRTDQKSQGVLSHNSDSSTSPTPDEPKARALPPRAKSDVWATPPELITTQEANRRENEKWKRVERQKYLLPLEENADPNGVGFILWNRGSSPIDLFDQSMKKLDHIRIDYKVYIDWQAETGCIRVSSIAEANAEHYVIKAIQAIRIAVDHARAEQILATPLYLAAPPSVEAMRALLRPRVVENGRLTGLEFAGKSLSADQKRNWKHERSELLKTLNKKFEKTMSKHMLRLALNKNWMRLRVHFGHVSFSLAQDNFKAGEQSFEQFRKMIANSRTIADLERKFDNALIATKLKQRIIEWPDHFIPVDGNVGELAEVKQKDTEVIFIQKSGTELAYRLEAEIDHNCDEGVDYYNVGTIRFFADDNRNRMMSITNIDIEKQVDWQVEVISDNTLPEKDCAPSLETMLRKSITTKSPQKTDALGFNYIVVRPVAPPSYNISNIVVRSVFQHKFSDSGYIVELAVYREWNGHSIQGTPKMEAGVSLYHPAWASALEDISRLPDSRPWASDATLAPFYDNGVDAENCGIEAFREAIDIVQDLVSSVQKVL